MSASLRMTSNPEPIGMIRFPYSLSSLLSPTVTNLCIFFCRSNSYDDKSGHTELLFLRFFPYLVYSSKS